MRTVLQALIDEIDYPFPEGKMLNRLAVRGLEPDDIVSAGILSGKEFLGAKADCLMELVFAPNFTEADKSVSLPDRDAILRMANSIYVSIGEADKVQGMPTVYVGED